MNNLIIEPTKKTPSVRLIPKEGIFELRGNSIHEDTGEFYRPIMSKLEEYFSSPPPLTVVKIFLTYYNSSSSKWILNLFRLFEKYSKQGHEIQIQWFYEADDEEVREDGIDYGNLLDIPIKMHQAS